MPADFFHILIHPSLVSVIRGESSPVRRQVRKTLERLQFGCWEGGTRVKLLKGVARPVFEARINLSLRLLFTVGRAAVAGARAAESCVLAWDLVDHDHIDRARRLNLSPDTAFLDFEPLAEAELDHTPASPERTHAPDTPVDRVIAALDGTRTAPADDTWRLAIRWFALDPDVVADDAHWQHLFDHADIRELELKLSPEQAVTVRTPGPVLLRGTAGSGKTTVCVYRLARLAVEESHARLLFVTLSEALLRSAESLYRDLLATRRQQPPEPGPDFLTLGDLCRRLMNSGPAPDKLVRYPLFAQWYRTIYGREDAALAWEEIRAIVKGSVVDPEREALTLDEYERLGAKRAPLFVRERPRLYRVFESYRAWCRQEGRYDDTDLARRALAILRRRSDREYDHVICDEGQDLTELDMRLLLQLVTSPAGLFLTADPQQIVNPSGFRWAELRSLLRLLPGQEPPPILGLSRNYRSARSIVAVANALVTIKRERTGRSDDDDLQEAALRGPAPVLVQGTPEQALPHLQGFGPGCAVIAMNTDEEDRLRRDLSTERVFNVSTAKGLEFETVVLWQPLAADLPLWRNILESDTNLKEDPVARRAIHHLYVAVTRARRHLAVIESDLAAAALWHTPLLRGLLESDHPDALARLLVNAATPEDWAAEARYFLERQRFRQAAECFRQAGDETAARAADADWLESIGEDGRAGELFRGLTMWARAGTCFRRGGRHREAAEMFERAEDWPAAAAAFELAGKLRRAADAWQRAGNTDAFRRNLRAHHERRQEWLEAARIALRQHDIPGAIDLYRRGGYHDQAERLANETPENQP